MHDLQGRPWATVAEVKAGSKVETDGDYDCMPEGAILTVAKDQWGKLYIPCSHGEHYLNGQISDDKTHYVGLYYVG